jgi:hypothetical protein
MGRMSESAPAQDEKATASFVHKLMINELHSSSDKNATEEETPFPL